MQLRNHIASKFINSHVSTDWICQKFRDNGVSEDAILNVYDNIKPDIRQVFYITDTIVDKVKLLLIKKYDWTVFKKCKEGKRVFILRNGDLIFSYLDEGVFFFLYINLVNFSRDNVTCQYIPFRIIIDNNDVLCEDKNTEYYDFTYKLLCFFFLSKNDERIIEAGKSYGSKKQSDALSNDLNLPVTIVNSNWNITSIRTDGFNVSGHFRLQPCGLQFSETKMIFIEPFKKHGYIRKAIKDDHV